MVASVIDRFREPGVDEPAPLPIADFLGRVPGMPLFSELLGLAARGDDVRALGRRRMRVVAGLDFARTRDPDAGTRLSCRPVPGRNRAWTVAAHQSGEEVCAGSIAFAGDCAEMVPGAAGRARPVTAEFVHRGRTEHVLVGEPVRNGRSMVESLLLDPPAEPGTLYRDAVEIVEAGRQFAAMLEQREHRRPASMALVWAALRLDIPVRVPRKVPLLVRWPVVRLPGRCAATLVDASSGADLGSLTYEAHAVTGP